MHSFGRTWAAGLALCLVVAAPVCCGEPASRLLLPGVPRLADNVDIGGPPVRRGAAVVARQPLRRALLVALLHHATRARCRYRLAGLQRDKGYEVRVSFPGTAAVRVRLWLADGSPAGSSIDGGAERGNRGGSDSGRRRRRAARRLLDAEKIMFATDAEGRVRSPDRLIVPLATDLLFSAEPWGRWREPQHAPQQLLYDIVLERSTLGVPHSALPLLATAVALVALVAGAVPWWSGRAVPAILAWLDDSTATPGGSAGKAAAARAAATGSGRPRRGVSAR